jgi:hypothetical protein
LRHVRRRIQSEGWRVYRLHLIEGQKENGRLASCTRAKAKSSSEGYLETLVAVGSVLRMRPLRTSQRMARRHSSKSLSRMGRLFFLVARAFRPRDVSTSFRRVAQRPNCSHPKAVADGVVSRERSGFCRCRYARLGLTSFREISTLDLRNEPRKKLTLLRAVKVESYPHSVVSRPYRLCHACKGNSVGVNVD